MTMNIETAEQSVVDVANAGGVEASPVNDDRHLSSAVEQRFRNTERGSAESGGADGARSEPKEASEASAMASAMARADDVMARANALVGRLRAAGALGMAQDAALESLESVGEIAKREAVEAAARTRARLDRQSQLDLLRAAPEERRAELRKTATERGDFPVLSMLNETEPPFRVGEPVDPIGAEGMGAPYTVVSCTLVGRASGPSYWQVRARRDVAHDPAVEGLLFIPSDALRRRVRVGDTVVGRVGNDADFRLTGKVLELFDGATWSVKVMVQTLSDVRHTIIFPLENVRVTSRGAFSEPLPQVPLSFRSPGETTLVIPSDREAARAMYDATEDAACAYAGPSSDVIVGVMAEHLGMYRRKLAVQAMAVADERDRLAIALRKATGVLTSLAALGHDVEGALNESAHAMGARRSVK